MYLTKSKTGVTTENQSHDFEHINSIRQVGKVLSPDQIKVGGYYIYKERYGMVIMVKILEDISRDGWTGYRLMVKQVLYACWTVPRGTVFEAGYYAKNYNYHTSWHFEPGMSLITSR